MNQTTQNHIVYLWGLQTDKSLEVRKWEEMELNLMFLLNCTPENYLDVEIALLREELLFLSGIAMQRRMSLRGDL